MNEFVCDTTEKLRLEIWQLENEANVKREAQEKARKEQERLIESGQLSEAVASGKIITEATVRVTEALNDYIEKTLTPSRGKPSKSVPVCRVLAKLDHKTRYNVIADCIAMCLDGIGIVDDNALIHQFGEHVEHEFMLAQYREQDRKAAQYLKDQLDSQAKTPNQRRKAISYSLSANRLQWNPWPKDKVTLIGQIIYHLVVDTGELFTVQPIVETF